jgi:uncharacterized protein (DUF305 family)
MDADAGNGLDSYEPQAFFSHDYYTAHTWHAELKLAGTADSSLSTADDTPLTTGVNDFFYFCHIHGGMSGRIKAVSSLGATQDGSGSVTFLNSGGDTKDGTPVFFPATDVEYYGEAPGALDVACGTNGLDEFKSGTGKCDDIFVCEADGLTLAGTTTSEKYGSCLDAMDCYMEWHMRTTLNADPDINFLEQMIPHHVNAVNMAKALIKLKPPADGTELKMILHNIVNVQSHQVQVMEGLLEAAYGSGVGKVDCAGPPMDNAASAVMTSAVSAVAAAAAAGAAAGFVGEL